MLEGDTVASAVYRAGVRTFTRSLKYHRRRGLYCGTGECPNCSLTVDGTPGVRSCVVDAREGMHVERAGGWPSTEHDVLHVTDRLHPLMPVGFYYKTFIRPRSAWPLAESVIRRATGSDASRRSDGPPLVTRHVRTDTLVVGAGISGLTAALDASVRGERVLVCDEARIGARVPPGTTRDAIRALEADVRERPNVELLEGHSALGVFEGSVVPLASDRELVQVHATRIVAATGATETHPVFPGNDLPGIWLGRGAARMAGIHRVSIGARTVVSASTTEGIEHLHALTEAGVGVVAAIVPSTLVDEVPRDVEAIVDGAVARAEGRRAIRAVVVSEGDAQADRVRRARAVTRSRPSRRAREDGLRRGRRDRRRCRTRRGRPGATGPRHRLPVRGRLDRRPRAGPSRGVPLRRDPQALHDRHDGSVSRRDVRPSADVLRACRIRGWPGSSDHGASTAPARRPRDPRGLGPRDRREAHVAARRAHRRRGARGLVRRLEAPVHLRRPGRGVPVGPRTRERDGRRNARHVPDRRAGGRDPGRPLLPDAGLGPRAGALALRARARRGGLRR